jgi:hypothetical protein
MRSVGASTAVNYTWKTACAEAIAPLRGEIVFGNVRAVRNRKAADAPALRSHEFLMVPDGAAVWPIHVWPIPAQDNLSGQSQPKDNRG